MLVDPEADGVKLALHVAVPVAPGTRLQVLEVKLPEAPAGVKVTVPAGVTFVPAVDVSVTVAVQVDISFTTTGLAQLTVVEVERKVTVTDAETVEELLV